MLVVVLSFLSGLLWTTAFTLALSFLISFPPQKNYKIGDRELTAFKLAFGEKAAFRNLLCRRIIETFNTFRPLSNLTLERHDGYTLFLLITGLIVPYITRVQRISNQMPFPISLPHRRRRMMKVLILFCLLLLLFSELEMEQQIVDALTHCSGPSSPSSCPSIL